MEHSPLALGSLDVDLAAELLISIASQLKGEQPTLKGEQPTPNEQLNRRLRVAHHRLTQDDWWQAKYRRFAVIETVNLEHHFAQYPPAFWCLSIDRLDKYACPEQEQHQKFQSEKLMLQFFVNQNGESIFANDENGQALDYAGQVKALQSFPPPCD